MKSFVLIPFQTPVGCHMVIAVADVIFSSSFLLTSSPHWRGEDHHLSAYPLVSPIVSSRAGEAPQSKASDLAEELFFRGPMEASNPACFPLLLHLLRSCRHFLPPSPSPPSSAVVIFFAPLLLLRQRTISERPSSFGRRHSCRRHLLLFCHDPPPAPAPAAVITTPRRGVGHPMAE